MLWKCKSSRPKVLVVIYSCMSHVEGNGNIRVSKPDLRYSLCSVQPDDQLEQEQELPSGSSPDNVAQCTMVKFLLCSKVANIDSHT